MSASELKSRNLPKWPQHYVTGEPITIEQAKEIIRRTDTFFGPYGGGNNREYNQAVRRMLRMPEDNIFDTKNFRQCIEREDAWKKAWGFIETDYVKNYWISSAFIGGPHGWCHPDGRIGFVDNVGKYPSVEEIYKDWKILAKEFPFLSIGATLYDGESCEDKKRPVVSFRISNGRVRIVDPEKTNVHEGHPEATRNSNLIADATDEFIANFNNPRREQGIDYSWIWEWSKVADRLFGAMSQ